MHSKEILPKKYGVNPEDVNILQLVPGSIEVLFSIFETK